MCTEEKKKNSVWGRSHGYLIRDSTNSNSSSQFEVQHSVKFENSTG